MLGINCIPFLCLSLVALCNADIVSHIIPCHINDDGCLLKSATELQPYVIAGDPNLGIHSLNPLVVKSEIVADKEELKLRFNDLHIWNLTECKIKAISRPVREKIILSVECPITATGHYNIGGKLFVLPVEGHGKCTIHTEQLNFDLTINLGKVENDGKCHYKVSGFDYKFHAKKQVHFVFENLYGGDQEKAKPLENLLQQNWKEIFDTFGDGIVKKLLTIVIKNVAKIFEGVPCNKIELE